MATIAQAGYDEVLRELWPQKRIDNLAFGDTPFLALLNKDTSFTEKIRHVALQYGNGNGRSATFGTAQSNSSGVSLAEFQVTRVSDHYVGQLTNELVEMSKDNKSAIISALDNEMKSGLSELSRSLHKNLFGDGHGSLGQIGSGATTASITLSNLEDVVGFQVGMNLVPTAAGFAGAPGTARTVTAVDQDTGVLTMSGNFGTSNGDEIIPEGDYVVAGDRKMVTGLAGWIPSSAPTSTAFFGLNRSTDPSALGGIRYNGSSAGTKKEALQLAAARLARTGYGARPSVILMNPVDVGDLIVELGASVQFEKMTGKGSDNRPSAALGFEAISIHTPSGKQSVVEDYQCPVGTCYMLDMNTWKLGSLGAAPHVYNGDGNSVLRMGSEDSLEFRLLYRAQLVCNSPGKNCVVTLP